MRLIGAASTVFVVALAFAASSSGPSAAAQQSAQDFTVEHAGSQHDGARGHRLGQRIFRYDTFGDEQLWTGVLRMHEVIATVPPATALAVGLKIDVEALPRAVEAAVQGRQNRPDQSGGDRRIAAVECGGRGPGHGLRTPVSSRASGSRARSATRRWTTRLHRALAVDWTAGPIPTSTSGAIVALSPALDAATKAEFNAWGPGRCHPRHHAFDGTNLLSLNSPSVPIVLPPIYGLNGVGFETVSARWTHLILERLRRSGPDGRQGHLPRSASRIVHHAEPGSRDAEAAGAAGLSIELAARRSRRRAASIRRPRQHAASVSSATRPVAPPVTRGRISRTS